MTPRQLEMVMPEIAIDEHNDKAFLAILNGNTKIKMLNRETERAKREVLHAQQEKEISKEQKAVIYDKMSEYMRSKDG